MQNQTKRFAADNANFDRRAVTRQRSLSARIKAELASCLLG